jgi:abortive infection bacteriophage resistance protein
VHYTVLESWLEHLVYIRNLCAHHNRIWNRDLIINKPVMPTHTIYPWAKIAPSKPDKLYTTLLLIVYMLKRINPTSSFTGRFRSLLHRHPMINIIVMGMPQDWRKDPFWQEVYIPWNQHLRINIFKLRAVFTKKSFAVSGKRLVQH